MPEEPVVSQADLRKMFVDMYLGADKENPPFTTRVALLEDFMEKLSKNLSALLLLGAATLLTVIGDLVYHAIAK